MNIGVFQWKHFELWGLVLGHDRLLLTVVLSGYLETFEFLISQELSDFIGILKFAQSILNIFSGYGLKGIGLI